MKKRKQRYLQIVEDNLKNEFKRIGGNHRDSILNTAARVTPGASVARIFEEGTKKELVPVLKNINMDQLLKLKNQKDYKVWFEANLKDISRVIKKTNPNKRSKRSIYPGYKWGHAAKILNLYVREVVENRHYFSEAQVRRIRDWLYVPIDSKVMRRLRELKMDFDFKKINEIKSRKIFYGVQDLLARAAKRAGVPRVWFDDIWGNPPPREDEQ